MGDISEVVVKEFSIEQKDKSILEKKMRCITLPTSSSSSIL
jgi:hypothetical protein